MLATTAIKFASGLQVNGFTEQLKDLGFCVFQNRRTAWTNFTKVEAATLWDY
jgi:hypothetical protein